MWNQVPLRWTPRFARYGANARELFTVGFAPVVFRVLGSAVDDVRYVVPGWQRLQRRGFDLILLRQM